MSCDTHDAWRFARRAVEAGPGGEFFSKRSRLLSRDCHPEGGTTEGSSVSGGQELQGGGGGLGGVGYGAGYALDCTGAQVAYGKHVG